MPRSNGRSNGDIRRVPDTFKLADWPRNCWYAAAYDVELKRELLPRTIAGRKLVLYRRENGEPVALENACWHRLMPLSEGKLEGDQVACGYHGLVYNPEGRCVFMPSQKTINPAARVRAFPVLERHRFVWVWTGDPALADPDLVPDLHWNDDPGVGRRRQAHPPQVRLQADRRQPDGPHARDVRARRVDRPALDRGGAVRGDARQPVGDGHALDARRRPAPVLAHAARVEAGQSRPARSTAGRSSTSRRRARSPSTSASRRPAAARPRATARRASTASCSTR